MNIRCRVTLSVDERAGLLEVVQRGKGVVRRLKRAQILLAADQGSTDEEIARNVAVGTSRRQPTLATRQGDRPPSVHRLRRVHAGSRRRALPPSPTRSASSSTTSRPTPRRRSTSASPLQKRAGFSAGWSSTSRPSTPAGSIMVEIEIGVMVSQCLDRRIPDKKTLAT